MNSFADSPLVSIYASLAALHPSWDTAIGRPRSAGWLTGTDLLAPSKEPFAALLHEIGRRAGTSDRRTIAAGFALRYAWSSAVAIAPYLVHHCVPDISLDNVSFYFRGTLFERAALHQPRGVMVRGAGWLPNPFLESVCNREALLARLRRHLIAQTGAVVGALNHWSDFSIRGIWGLMTSSWATQFTRVLERLGKQDLVVPLANQFFAGDDVVADMKPMLYPVTYGNVTRICQRQASCCRYTLLPTARYCAACPLIDQEERVRRNQVWIARGVNS